MVFSLKGAIFSMLAIASSVWRSGYHVGGVLADISLQIGAENLGVHVETKSTIASTEAIEVWKGFAYPVCKKCPGAIGCAKVVILPTGGHIPRKTLDDILKTQSPALGPFLASNGSVGVAITRVY
jgi:hypothetical protein